MGFTINSLKRLKNNDRPILSCYLPLGDPAVVDNLVDIYLDCGVEIFEVGIPCRDAYMDGPVVTKSMQRTIQAGVKQSDIAKEITKLKEQYQDIAVVVMGYENMKLDELLVNGKVPFDGVLRIGSDEEFKEEKFSPTKHFEDIDFITFIPYEMSQRDVEGAHNARGYIMLQASPGKTGVRESLDDSSREKIKILRQAGVKIPILLGIGISTSEQAATAIELGADGVIMGSVCLLNAEQGEKPLRELLSKVREAMNAVRQ